MGSTDENENSRRLENIELLLKSIDYQLGKLLQILSTPMGKEEKKVLTTGEKIPEMVTIKDASRRTGLSYLHHHVLAQDGLTCRTDAFMGCFHFSSYLAAFIINYC